MKARARQNRIADLELRLDEIDNCLNRDKCSKLQEERKLVKLRLDDMYKEKSKGYQVRARDKWVEKGVIHSLFL